MMKLSVKLTRSWRLERFIGDKQVIKTPDIFTPKHLTGVNGI